MELKFILSLGMIGGLAASVSVFHIIQSVAWAIFAYSVFGSAFALFASYLNYLIEVQKEKKKSVDDTVSPRR